MISAVLLSFGLSLASPAVSLTAKRCHCAPAKSSRKDNTAVPKAMCGSAEAYGAARPREVRRTVYAGQSIRPAGHTDAPRLVKRNQLVDHEIHAEGPWKITHDRAAPWVRPVLDETVTVLNLQSRQVVEGTVQAGGWIWVK